jgi:hypothetical protein
MFRRRVKYEKVDPFAGTNAAIAEDRHRSPIDGPQIGIAQGHLINDQPSIPDNRRIEVRIVDRMGQKLTPAQWEAGHKT